jgi:hypothetical protein
MVVSMDDIRKCSRLGYVSSLQFALLRARANLVTKSGPDRNARPTRDLCALALGSSL